MESAPSAATTALAGRRASKSSMSTSADVPPAASMPASRGCEAMLPRARAAWLGVVLGLGARGNGSGQGDRGRGEGFG